MRNFFLVLILLCSISSFAQLLPFRTYTEKDGLNNKAVYSTVRDDRGLLWVGTPFGINWFDGTHFYQPPVPKKVDQVYVQKFYKDREGIIWTLTFYNGFYKFQNDQFTQYLIDTTYADINQNNIIDMVEMPHGQYAIAADRGVFLFDGKKFHRLDSDNLEGQMEAVNFFDNCLFVGFGKGLYSYSYNGKWRLLSKNLEGIPVNKILEANHHVFVATAKGLYCFDYFDPQKINQPKTVYLKNVEISDVGVNANNEIWFAADGASYKLSGNKLVEYGAAEGLKAKVNHIYFDYQSNGWLSTDQGLYKLGEEYFSFTPMKDGPVSLAKTTDNVWMSYPTGISDLGGKYHYQFADNAAFTCLYYAPRSKQLWIANENGVFVLNDHQVQKKFSFHCSYLYEDDDTTTWIATDEGKLFILKNDRLQPVSFNCFQNDFVSTILKDRNGFVWLGFRTGGVIKCKMENFGLTRVKEFSVKTGFPDLRIRSCYNDGETIFFGTRTNGLFIFSVNNNQYWHINNSNGLNATWVTSMAASDTAVYLTTNGGLFVLRKESSYGHPQIAAVNFPNEEISKQMNCVLVDGTQVWIGSNGMTRFLPERFHRDSSPAPVFITQVSVEGKADSSWMPYSSQKSTLHLPHNKNVIAFDFAGIHLKDEDALHYRYKLEGQDKDWSSAAERNFVSYNLPPGKYRFVVQAQNASGKWSDHPASYSFIIAQPFWSTWWFLALNIFLALAIVYLIYQYRLRQAMKFERLRYKISTDLHDDIGSTLSSISILSEMALTEHNPIQNEAMVAEIKENSLSLLEKMDDIVWSINPKNDSLESLLLRIKRFSSKLFEAKDIDYAIDIDKAVAHAKLPMEFRQHIYLILKEAINNLVKYSQATKAAIEVNYSNSVLKIRVSDNGKGFGPGANNSGNGIISMKTRAEMMAANLKIESSINEGTTIRLEVKIK